MFCLRTPTDPSWGRQAVKDLDAVLVDHAHCEMKAATNALSLVLKQSQNLALVRALNDLAREELEHFGRVVSFIEQRGLSLGLPGIDTYAAELRRAMGRLPPADVPSLVDRLLVGALIEARSCERFKVLLDVLPDDVPTELRAFYEELFACEARHYRTYVELAVQALCAHRPQATHDEVEREANARLSLLADEEGRIVRALADSDARATVHG